MNDPTLIADLIRSGVDPELIARMVKEITDAYASLSGGSRVDVQLEKRRAWDREYRRKQRESRVESGGIHPTSANALSKEDSNKDLKNRKRQGERIPPDWKPLSGDIAFALAKGLLAVRLETEAEKFRNYWTAKSGAAATKVDWSATWRNWVLTSLERSGTPMPTAPPPLDAKPAWAIPPWERDGISEKAWKERELGKANGAQVRRDS